MVTSANPKVQHVTLLAFVRHHADHRGFVAVRLRGVETCYATYEVKQGEDANWGNPVNGTYFNTDEDAMRSLRERAGW